MILIPTRIILTQVMQISPLWKSVKAYKITRYRERDFRYKLDYISADDIRY